MDNKNKTVYYGICNQVEEPLFGHNSWILLDKWPKNNLPIIHDLWPQESQDPADQFQFCQKCQTLARTLVKVTQLEKILFLFSHLLQAYLSQLENLIPSLSERQFWQYAIIKEI